MWEWMLQEVKIAARTAVKYQTGNIRLRNCDIDDIVSETCCHIFTTEGMAEQIYKNKNTKMIYGIVKKVVFEKKADMFFGSNGKGKKTFSDYCIVCRVCNEYGIEPVPENAYKIQAILESEYDKKIKNSKTTRGIVSLFKEIKPLFYYYGLNSFDERIKIINYRRNNETDI